MADVYTPEKRSRIMAAIRSSGTAPEEHLYSIVRGALGRRWRIDRNVRALPGQPDIVIPSLRLAIFLDGCFYHCCPRHGRIPKSNRAYWAPKLARNVCRDRANSRALRRIGFGVWRIWEHALAMDRPLSGLLSRRLIARAAASRSCQFREPSDG
jgi:DNA mismatch endonuclease (patch repair protein)